jgi:hypothetical protein
VLFPPQSKQRLRQPAPVRLEPVDDRVAGGAQSDQRSLGMLPGFPVMNGVLMGCPASLAAVAIPREDSLPMAAEAAPRVGYLGITAPAQSGAKELEVPAEAEEAGLCRIPQGLV